ncbi:MAG: glycosyltransferase family 39 protein [Flavobacteriales bacterium]
MTTRAFNLYMLTLILVVGLGSVLDVMEVDAAQYAGMSRDMLLNGDLLELHYRGEDYLDKPPLLFWLSALSFKIFGVHNWSYRLPSILFAFLGIYSTYRFAALYHGKEAGRIAATMFGGSAAFILMTNDVRCDTILTSAVITAIWAGCAWLVGGRTVHLVACSVAIGAGLLVKGPIGAIAPAFALGAQLIHTKAWRKLLDPRLLLVPMIILVMLLPMCIGLYEQFGMHGLRFYFWEQSFGRITGENRWVDDSSVLFFTHELPWQVLPWVVFVLAGIGWSVKDLFTERKEAEHASTAGALLVFAALSLSQFKLPHYLYVTLPLFAVVGAKAWLYQGRRLLIKIHYFLLALLWTLTLGFTWVVFPERNWPYLTLLILFLIGAIIYLRKEGGRAALIPLSFGAIMIVGVFMNGHFYPNLLTYQANAKVGQWVKEKELDEDHFYGLQVSGSALDHYAGFPVRWLSNAEEARTVIAPGVVIYTDAQHVQELIDAGLDPVNTTHYHNYPVQLIGIDFLLPEQRRAVLEDRFVLEF